MLVLQLPPLLSRSSRIWPFSWAQSAAAAARAHRDAGGLAEALELRGAASTDPREARQAYCEALAIHCDAGAEVYADLVRVALGRLPGAAADVQSRARLAAGRLTELHVVVPDADGPVVQIQAMGQFRVLVDGEPVPAASWQSRKARDLLRILITRRGRPTSREELVELLWEPTPDEADKVGHRLAALLSILRGVLDPGRRAATDHFITADASNLALNLDRLVIDVESFLDDARHGLRLHARGASDQAGPLLRAAEASYAEVFAGDPYDTWLQALREEARAVYLQVARVLAELSRRAGDFDDAVRYLLRILSHDPYDEQSHHDLVTVHLDAGRYGEARRGYDRYAAAMAELGLPAPTALASTAAVLARNSIVAVSGHSRSGVRVRPGGVQRRAARTAAGLGQRREVSVGRGPVQAGDHASEADPATGVAGRGVLGRPAAGTGRPERGLPQLLRFLVGQT